MSIMPDGNRKSPSPPVGKLQNIKVDDISRNERNPRQTFDQDRIEKLAASLEEIGLQVPITVYANGANKKHAYTLLDGERRLRAAKLINWESIPAIVVAPPSRRENAIRMFNIHMLREEWEEIETAWALEQIMEETGTSNDRELQRLTGLTIDRIRNMKRVLDFPQSIQEKVAEGELPYQLLVELDKNVLSRKRQEDKSADEPVMALSAAKLRDTFLQKYLSDVEKDVVELRKVGTLYDTALGEGKVADRARAALDKLVGDPQATIEDAYDAGAASSVELTKVLRDVAALPERVGDLLDSALEPDQRAQVLEALLSLQKRLTALIRKAQG
jgi:ParB family chromosome partitioning protein